MGAPACMVPQETIDRPDESRQLQNIAAFHEAKRQASGATKTCNKATM